MNAPSPYNANPELSAMKDDVAQRNYRLTMKEMLIVGGIAVAGAATGGLLIGPLLGSGLFAAAAGGMIGVGLGSIIAPMSTMKERTKLKIDEDMVQSYMSGKNYWGEGYREEVLEHGYGGPQTPNVPNAPRRDTRQNSR